MKPLVVVTRNDYIESMHDGLVCVVDATGHVLYNIGDFNTKIYFRSCAKPLQVIPLIQSGAAEALGFSLRDIAIACASHTGQQFHQRTVDEILKRLELGETNLHCGTMNPYNEEESNRLVSEGHNPSVFHCSCSGKHSAMLALGKFRGYPLEDYESITNPIQEEILHVIAEFSGEEAASISTGLDGCGAPIYLLPVYKVALSYARMMQYVGDSQSEWHHSCKNVFGAMTQFPEMVAGDGEFCTELMQVTKDKLIGKVGGEGVYCVGIKDKKLGICIKITDGNERAVYPAVMQTLKDLDILSADECAKLEPWYQPAVKNNSGRQTGEIIPVFRLKNAATQVYHLGEKLSPSR